MHSDSGYTIVKAMTNAGSILTVALGDLTNFNITFKQHHIQTVLLISAMHMADAHRTS